MSTTYKFLNECLSFPTNAPLSAVNMHAYQVDWPYYKVVPSGCLLLKGILGMILLLFQAFSYSIVILDTKYSVNGS